jgi:hypothetical protein
MGMGSYGKCYGTFEHVPKCALIAIDNKLVILDLIPFVT